MSRPGDRALHEGREADGIIWFTIRQAAAFVGYDRQTIYSWERRGILTDPRTDEHGRRVYSQQQISDAYKATQAHAEASRRAA
ncbi:MerR family transcriptional regulator [Streptomyces lunaelactis]|uniref:MerR family transcriptional regulator n=1 Tax=Streptomyces lunaelactis TaxID=1535768 RepID=UPI00158528F8|nr:MerR family transcriptional regulator [Streptomyces lunaelactis]NUL09082.1 MerR family transcriptional regulator [Streptomyces lunaelactis]